MSNEVLDSGSRSDLDQESFCRELVEQCRRHLPRADRVLLLLQEGHYFHLKASFGSKAAFIVTQEKVSRFLIRRVRKTGEPLLITDVFRVRELQCRESVNRIGQRSVLCVPIKDQENVVGLLYADSISQVEAFESSHQEWAIEALEDFYSRYRSLPERKRKPERSVAPLESAQHQKPPDQAEGEETLFRELRRRVLYSQPGLLDKALFFRSLSCMLDSGFSIYSALGTLAESESRLSLHASQMQADVGEGRPLSHAMSRFPTVFAVDVRSLVKVGENTGTLDISLASLADSMERETALRKKIQSALVYPAFLLGFCLLGCLIAPPLFLNDMLAALARMNTTLPWLTRAVMGFAATLWHPLFWIGMALLGAGSWLLWRKLRRRSSFMSRCEQLVLDTPVFGEMVKNYFVLKFVRALGLQVEAGLYLDKAIRNSGKASGSLVLNQECDRLVARLMAGETFAFGLSRSPLFPKLLVEFARVGEETGKLKAMFDSAQELLKERTENSIEVWQSLLEPVAMGLVGIVVGTISLACLLPLVRTVQALL